MTVKRSFKRLVRSRMAKTGESYTAARAALLLGRADTDASATETAAIPVLATSDDAIRQRTGRGWEEWFDLLDEQGMSERPHREIARWVAQRQGVVPLAWAAQAVTVSYERARVGRLVGEHPDGFAVTASRTIGAPDEAVFEAIVDDSLRGRWLPGIDLRPRTLTRPRAAHFDVAHDGSADGTRVHVTIRAKGPRSTSITVEHARLADHSTAAQRKTWWREGLSRLKEQLEVVPEGGADHA